MRGNLATRNQLNKLEERLLELMVWGVERPLPHYPEIAPRVPLSHLQAGDMLRMRRQYVRDLMQTPMWQRAMTAAVAALRNGEKAASWHTIIQLRDDPGEGKAADRKVQLEAAKTILGEQDKGPSVNVQINNATTLTPGYVIKPPTIIDGEASDQ
jgi:hypothetical protein